MDYRSDIDVDNGFPFRVSKRLKISKKSYLLVQIGTLFDSIPERRCRRYFCVIWFDADGKKSRV